MENFFHWLVELDFSVLVWLLPAAVTIHMIEEMIWLPKWSKTAGSWHVPVSRGQFALASLILLAIVFAVAAAASLMLWGGAAVYLAAGLALTFLFNIYQPHVGSLITLKRYPPGLATGLLINLPLMPFLIWQAVSDGYMDGLIFLLLAVPLVAAAAVGWSVLLYTGSILLK
jgi:hypothetical protein